jgi:hypothetical protein
MPASLANRNAAFMSRGLEMVNEKAIRTLLSENYLYLPRLQRRPRSPFCALNDYFKIMYNP